MHLNGSLNKPLTRETLVQNTKILVQENNPHRLLVMDSAKEPFLESASYWLSRNPEAPRSRPSAQEPPQSTQTTPR